MVGLQIQSCLAQWTVLAFVPFQRCICQPLSANLCADLQPATAGHGLSLPHQPRLDPAGQVITPSLPYSSSSSRSAASAESSSKASKLVPDSPLIAASTSFTCAFSWSNSAPSTLVMLSLGVTKPHQLHSLGRMPKLLPLMDNSRLVKNT